MDEKLFKNILNEVNIEISEKNLKNVKESAKQIIYQIMDNNSDIVSLQEKNEKLKKELHELKITDEQISLDF